MLLASLTKAINTYLQLDPESRQRLKKLQHQIITIEFLPFKFVFQLLFYDDHVELKTAEQLPANVKIRGTPLQMLGIALTKNRHRFFAEDLSIEGNVEIGQQMLELFDELKIDWEEHLAYLVGDIPAYQARLVMQNIKQWLNHVKKSLTLNLNEYIHEEITVLPASEALQDFFDEIDILRMDVDRIEVRLHQLQESLAGHSENEV
jgi:ubiquinone biosynthesis protein UbiJ